MDNATHSISPEFEQVVKKMASDMKFVGIFEIIYGALCCLTIVGAIFGVPYIIAGLRLRESAEAYEGYVFNQEYDMLERAITRQGSYYLMMKIAIIIAVSLFILISIAYTAIIGFVVSEALQNMPS